MLITTYAYVHEWSLDNLRQLAAFDASWSNPHPGLDRQHSFLIDLCSQLTQALETFHNFWLTFQHLKMWREYDTKTQREFSAVSVVEVESSSLSAWRNMYFFWISGSTYFPRPASSKRRIVVSNCGIMSPWSKPSKPAWQSADKRNSTSQDSTNMQPTFTTAMIGMQVCASVCACFLCLGLFL